MRYIFIFLILFILPAKEIFAQVVAEGASGESSLLYNNSNIGFNLGEAELSVSMSNFRKLTYDQKIANDKRTAYGRLTFLYGINAKAKNAEGLSQLWNSGNLTPASKITGVLGFRFIPVPEEEIAQFIALGKLDPEMKTLTGELYVLQNVKTNLTDSIKKYNITGKAGDLVIDTIVAIKKAVNDDLDTLMTKLYSLITNLPEGVDPKILFFLKKVAIGYFSNYYTVLKRYNELAKEMEGRNKIIDGIRNKRAHKSVIVALTGGMESSAFSGYDAGTESVFSKKFPDVKFRGGFLDLNFNYDFGRRFIFGFALGYEKANTFDSLAKKEYTLRKTDTSGNQQLVSEKKYTAYSGFYKVYDRMNIKADVLYFAELGDSARCVWNVLYARCAFPINESAIKPVVNIGTALNVYKTSGKFVGGIYLQQNDLFNKVSGEDSDFWKRLSFGIVAKYTFASIINRNLK